MRWSTESPQALNGSNPTPRSSDSEPLIVVAKSGLRATRRRSVSHQAARGSPDAPMARIASNESWSMSRSRSRSPSRRSTDSASSASSSPSGIGGGSPKSRSIPLGTSVRASGVGTAAAASVSASSAAESSAAESSTSASALSGGSARSDDAAVDPEQAAAKTTIVTKVARTSKSLRSDTRPVHHSCRPSPLREPLSSRVVSINDC